MKRSGRTLKQRLYGLKHLSSRLRRARYFRGHGVHSPYIYNIVRQVFMRSTPISNDHALYDALQCKDIKHRRALQLQNLCTFCDYSSWSIDKLTENVSLLIATLDVAADHLAYYAQRATEIGATLCIIAPYHDATRWEACSAIIEAHHSTSVDNRGYLLLFNNHLPKQRFRL